MIIGGMWFVLQLSLFKKKSSVYPYKIETGIGFSGPFVFHLSFQGIK